MLEYCLCERKRKSGRVRELDASRKGKLTHLPLVKNESRLGEKVEGVLGSGSISEGLLLLLVNLLGLGSGLDLLSLRGLRSLGLEGGKERTKEGQLESKEELDRSKR